MSVVLEPPFEQWADILRANRARGREIGATLGLDRMIAIRKAIIAEARDYTDTLASVADNVGVSLHVDGNPDCVPEKPIIMAGHQPTIYHSGLFFKAKMLSKLARDNQALGILVDIDTDVGDAGKLVWPRLTDGRLEIMAASLTSDSSNELYRSQILGAQSHIEEIFKRMREDLVSAGLHNEAQRAAAVGDLYRALEGRPLAIANAIVRARFEERRYLQVPLSRLAQHTDLGELLRNIVQDAQHFSTVYNSCLDAYRKEHKIKNQANPFPNLKATQEGQELPLWRVSASGRNPVLCGVEGDAGLRQGEFLASRGSVTTMLLRAYCSDLFIHGLGGANYDRFVDIFSSKYLKVTLPRFVVASETRHLFPAQVAKTSSLLELASQFKDIVARTEHFLGRGIFSHAEEEALVPLLTRRRELRATLQVSNGEDARGAISRALNECNRQVRSLIESTVVHHYAQQATALKRELERWSFREYPFFLFD